MIRRLGTYFVTTATQVDPSCSKSHQTCHGNEMIKTVSKTPNFWEKIRFFLNIRVEVAFYGGFGSALPVSSTHTTKPQQLPGALAKNVSQVWEYRHFQVKWDLAQSALLLSLSLPFSSNKRAGKMPSGGIESTLAVHPQCRVSVRTALGDRRRGAQSG